MRCPFDASLENQKNPSDLFKSCRHVQQSISDVSLSVSKTVERKSRWDGSTWVTRFLVGLVLGFSKSVMSLSVAFWNTNSLIPRRSKALRRHQQRRRRRRPWRTWRSPPTAFRRPGDRSRRFSSTKKVRVIAALLRPEVNPLTALWLFAMKISLLHFFIVSRCFCLMCHAMNIVDLLCSLVVTKARCHYYRDPK